MDPAWAPVVAVIVGVLASPLTTFVLERVRHRQAKVDATYAFQRRTITDLQESMERINGLFSSLEIMIKNPPDSEPDWMTTESVRELEQDYSRIAVLSSRVMDETVRSLVNQFHNMTESILMRLNNRNIDITAEEWKSVNDIFRDANAHMGVLVRETYQSVGDFTS